MNSRVTIPLYHSWVVLILVAIIQIALLQIAAHGSTCSNENNQFQSISRRGVKCYRDQEYGSALNLFKKAIDVAERARLSPEQRANAYVCLSSCQFQTGDYKNSVLTLKKAEQIINDNKVDNPALIIRLLRRRTDINERCYNWSEAIASQIELCNLYEKNVGRLILGNFAERGRLQHLELRAKNYRRCAELGQELLGLLAKFRVSPTADITIRTNLTQGKALIFAGRESQGCDALQKVYETAKEGSPDLAAHAAAWQVFCARTQKNEARRIAWTKRLEAVVEASHQTRKYWLDGVEDDWRQGHN